MFKYSLKQIAVFDAVASQESVSAAAKKLSMTQSAVSMSLSQLESVLDRPLFNRQGNRLVLSHWGHWLRPRAKKLLQHAQQIEFGLHEQHLISGNLTLCSSQTAAKHLLPSLISKIDNDFPEMRINLMVENTENVIEALLNYDCDLGIIEGKNSDSRLQTEHWLDDDLVVIASPNHPFAHYKQVTLAQLEQAKWVLREPGAGTRRIFDGAVHGLIDNIKVWKEYESVRVIKSMVANGSYLGCVPYLDIVQELENNQLKILPTPQLNMQREISFIWRTDSGESPLRECLLSEARRLTRGRSFKPHKSTTLV
ncbi:transcriptional regulator, lysR family [Vibrio ishigakensis]|uniref:Transcriptional regulator, lysR family n=1 Tax=Vibrio ishigakensis TaxID=1481914 RepID=A0A0B8NMW2_9VIBR|nr:LysR substrate-binding domain-containing protein [Vibrio ishigakensis]GAM55980.1 transcriptional regulator, lysR family [Vibrio ishigakensis]